MSRRFMSCLVGVGSLAAIASVAWVAAVGALVLPPDVESDCSGQVPIVVASDLAAQSDLYSAATLAGVLGTSCVVLAGARDEPMPADQLVRLEAADAEGWMVGGTAAVSIEKVAGRRLKRLDGVDRWHTARLAGAVAADPDGDVAALTTATAPVTGAARGTSVIVDGIEVRLPPGIDSDCAGQVPIVVAVDAAAQADLYSAATLAGVLDTTCIVLAGPRGEAMTLAQRGRLFAAKGDGWIVGGEAAVPPAKTAGYHLARQGGTDRWHTARLIGRAAVAQAVADSDEGEASGGYRVAGRSDQVPNRVAHLVPVGASAQDGSVSRSDGGPVRGGRLVYGIEADTGNPFVHYVSSCAISCQMIFRAVTDSLFVTDAEGVVVPYLVEPGSVVSSDDFLSWSFDVREGILFHDGTPFDGAAAAYNINVCLASPLTGPGLESLVGASADGRTVTLTYSRPAARGPLVYRADRCGFMFSPTWMQTLASNPLLSDDERANASGDQSMPVGLGAFRVVSYTPGNGNSLVAVRNEEYWRGPNGVTGEVLPYLDEVEFVVAADIQSRSNGLQGGQFDVIHTTNGNEIARFQGDDDFVLLAADQFGETSYVMLNVAAGSNETLGEALGLGFAVPMDPSLANADSPLLHLSCRKALAHAIDRQRYVDERVGGLASPANGPFPPNSIGYLADTGYPEYDPELAAAEFEQCKADTGEDVVRFEYSDSADPFNIESNQLIVSMLTDVFGDEIDLSIAPLDQAQYVNNAIAGNYQAYGWRNHGGIDPIEQWYWWHSATAGPIGQQALNFGRFQDPAIDEALNIIRHVPDPNARTAAAEAVNRAFGENVWNLWTHWTLWGIIANPRLTNLTDLTIPDHPQPTMPIISGQHHLTQIWCQQGNCQG